MHSSVAQMIARLHCPKARIQRNTKPPLQKGKLLGSSRDGQVESASTWRADQRMDCHRFNAGTT